MKHAPAAEGRCIACHDPHASDRPHLVRDDPRRLCLSCHGSIPRGGAKTPVDRSASAHQPIEAGCTPCHEGPHGGARAKLLSQDQPDLCYRCHARKDARKTVHAALGMAACTECHAAHASDVRPLLKDRTDRLCEGCHDRDGIAPGPYVHAPATEGSCIACHDAHSTDEPKLVRTSSSSLCLSCHDAKAPSGKHAPGPRARIDRARVHVHGALDRGCSSCHDAGHSSDRPHFLREPVAQLCYRCHKRVDGGPYVHGAVLAGACDGCHDPHSSDRPRLLRGGSPEATCFRCHDDEVKRRKVLHRPLVQGDCAGCHAPHSAAARAELTRGRGDETCLACHPGVGDARRPHAALVRYGCTACHDAHGAAFPALLPAETNELCAACHPHERNGAHAALGTGVPHPVSGFPDPRRPGRALSCTSCHDPHASEGPALMRYGGGKPAESCDVCHEARSGPAPLRATAAVR